MPFRLQLSTARGDVDPPALAHGAGQACVLDDLLEGADLCVRRGLPPEAFGGIQRNQIYMRIHSLQERRELVRVFRTVVDAADQGPGEEHTGPLDRRVFATGLQQVAERPLFVDRHEATPLHIVDTVQTDGQRVALRMAGQFQDTGDMPDRADRHAGGPDVQPAIVGQDIERFDDRLEICHRLPHPHHHDIPKPVALPCPQGPFDMMRLRDDLTRSEMAREAHLPGRAKNTAHRTAHLAAQAGGVASGKTHANRLDLCSAIEPEKIFFRKPVSARDAIYLFERAQPRI